MKKIIIFLIAVVFSVTAYAESSVWKLDSDTNSNFYIAGSCHLLSKSDYPLPDEFESAYVNVDRIIFETDMEAIMSPEIQMLLARKGTYTGDDTLENKLSKKSYAIIDEYCNDNAIPIGVLQKLKPWMVALTLMFIELEKIGVTPADGLETYFNEKAKRDGKHTGGLEDAKEHVEYVSAMDEELDDAIIESFAKEIEELHVMMKDITKAWKAGDEAALNEYISESLSNEFPNLHKRLIIDRNRNWISPIEDMINSGKRTLVVVGVGHLIGEESVINLLRSKGHKIEKLQ